MKAMRHVMFLAWVVVLLGLAGEVAAQNTTPPGYLNRTRQYRRGSGSANVNSGMPRWISTFLPVVNTNGMNVVTVYETVTIGTNLATSVQVLNNQSLSLTATTSRATMIRSMTVTANYNSRYPDGTVGIPVGSAVTTFTLAKDAGGPVVLKVPLASPLILLWNPNLVVNVTFDLAAADSSMTPYLLGTDNPVTFRVQPQTSSVFAAYTNQTCTGTWIFNIRNTTGDDNFYLSGFSVNVMGDAQSMSISGGGVSRTKDLTPRGISERAPYRMNADGTRTYPLIRNESER